MCGHRMAQWYAYMPTPRGSSDYTAVMVVANETHGSNSFHLSMLSNPSFPRCKESMFPGGVTIREIPELATNIARLPAITSRVESLAARAPSARVVHKALVRGKVKCVSVGDSRAVRACVGFAGTSRVDIRDKCS